MTITELQCCERSLETLLRKVRNYNDVLLVERVIEEYQDKYKVELTKYHHQIQKLKEVFYDRLRI